MAVPSATSKRSWVTSISPLLVNTIWASYRMLRPRRHTGNIFRIRPRRVRKQTGKYRGQKTSERRDLTTREGRLCWEIGQFFIIHITSHHRSLRIVFQPCLPSAKRSFPFREEVD